MSDSKYTDHDLKWLENRINSEAGPQLAPYLIRLLGEYRLAREALARVKDLEAHHERL